jgi:hypothetical protein
MVSPNAWWGKGLRSRELRILPGETLRRRKKGNF